MRRPSVLRREEGGLSAPLDSGGWTLVCPSVMVPLNTHCVPTSRCPLSTVCAGQLSPILADYFLMESPL